MGGGPDPKPENLLVVVPVPVPSHIIERIKKKHPNINVTVRNTQLTDTPWEPTGIPKGWTPGSNDFELDCS